LGARVYTGDGKKPMHDKAVIVKDGKIVDIVDAAEVSSAQNCIEADIVAPGFVDLQLNGAGGVQFNDHPNSDAIQTMDKAAKLGGTAWFFPLSLPIWILNIDTQ